MIDVDEDSGFLFAQCSVCPATVAYSDPEPVVPRTLTEFVTFRRHLKEMIHAAGWWQDNRRQVHICTACNMAANN